MNIGPTSQKIFITQFARVYYQTVEVHVPENVKVEMHDGIPKVVHKVTSHSDPMHGMLEILTLQQATDRGLLVARSVPTVPA